MHAVVPTGTGSAKMPQKKILPQYFQLSERQKVLEMV